MARAAAARDGEVMATPDPNRPRVLVTGSSGLIGSRAVDRLADRFRVIGLDRDPPPERWRGEESFRCDLTDDDSVARTLQEIERRHGRAWASVIHLAAYYDFSGEPSPLYDELTVEGTRRLLRGLRRLDVEQVLFASTLLVMKPVAGKGDALREDDPVRAEWEYPESKLAAERCLEEERGDMRVVVLRISGVYDEDCHSLPIAQQIRRIHARELESHLFPGDQDRGQPFLHISDLIDCMERTIDRRRDLDEVETFLVAEPEVLPYGDLQERIGELLHGEAWTTLRVPKPVAKAGAWVRDKIEDETFIKPWMVDIADAHYPVAIDRARTRLDWSPRHRLADVLPEMIRRLKEDPEAWYETNGLEVPADVRKDGA